MFLKRNTLSHSLFLSLAFFASAPLTACKTRTFGTNPQKNTSGFSKTQNTAGQFSGFPASNAPGDKETYIFNYADFQEGERPERRMRKEEANWLACSETLRKTGSISQEPNCTTNGIWRGYGIYFAEDPFVSAAYGNSLTVFRIKPGVTLPNIGQESGDGSPALVELWSGNVPAVRYEWGGHYTGTALILRESKNIVAMRDKETPDLWHFNRWKPTGDSEISHAARAFHEIPGLKCKSGQTLRERLDAWVEHTYFMDKVLDADKKGEPLVVNGKLTDKGILWAIASEINAQTLPVRKAMKKYKAPPGEPSRSPLSWCRKIDNSCMEVFEVLASYFGRDESGYNPGNEPFDAGVDQFLKDMGFIGTDFNGRLNKDLTSAMIDTWKKRPTQAEQKALEAAEMASCMKTDLQPNSFAEWR